MTDKIEYNVTANPDDFNAGMDKTAKAAKEAARQIESSFKAVESSMKSVSDAFRSVTAALGALTAIMAGGAAFKGAINDSAAWTGESKKLAAQLGLTTERASVMLVAMRHLGIDSETMSAASSKLAKQIFTNGQAFEKLGVQVKDANGQYRPTTQIMAEVNDKLKEIKNPIEQSIAGAQVYGKSWQEVRGTLKLTSDELKAAEQKAIDLGLVVGEAGVAQTKAYKESLNDMSLVMTSLEVQLGNAVLPAFVKIGSWLSGVGPVAAKAMGVVMESLGSIMSMVGDVVMELWGIVRSGFSAIGDLVRDVFGVQAPGAMEIFTNVLKVVEVAFAGLKVAIRMAIEATMGVIDVFVAKVLRMADTAQHALKLDFTGAKAAWETGTAIVEDVQKRHVDKLVRIAAEGQQQIDDIIMRGPKAAPAIKDKDVSGGPTYDFDKEGGAKDKSRIHEWEAMLAADKDGFAKQQAIAGTAREFSIQQERDYWKGILDTVKMSKEERAQVEKKFYAAEAQIRKDQFENEIAGEKASLENYKNNHLARLEIANRVYEANVARYGAESKEAKAALAEVYKEQRAYADQLVATNKVIAESNRNKWLAEVDAAQQNAEFQLATGRITQGKLLELQAEFEAKRYQIKMQALQEELALMQGSDENPTALAAIHVKIEELERQHQLRMSQIKGKSTVEQSKNITEMYGSMQSGFQRVIAGTLQGTMQLRDIFKNLFQTVVSAVIDMLAKTAAEWAMNMILGRATGSATALGQIGANAAVAGSAAFASTAAIPIIGPELAPEAAMAAYSGAMAFAPMASARGGFDIPSGLNPVTQLHEKEMVLPAKHADVIRNLADGGNGGVGGGDAYHLNVSFIDPRGAQKFLQDNAKTMVAVLKDYAKRQ